MTPEWLPGADPAWRHPANEHTYGPCPNCMTNSYLEATPCPQWHPREGSSYVQEFRVRCTGGCRWEQKGPSAAPWRRCVYLGGKCNSRRCTGLGVPLLSLLLQVRDHAQTSIHDDGAVDGAMVTLGLAYPAQGGYMLTARGAFVLAALECEAVA